MASDCTVAIDNGYINMRVGAIIMKDNKFLMVGNQKDEYLYSVGGRIQFGESAEEAVVREVFEETGVRLEVDRLGFVHENFFYGDYGKKSMGRSKLKIGIAEENKILRKWYQNFGFEHVGTKKYDFFPFTCGYMEKSLED